jgi:hypothetical protein
MKKNLDLIKNMGLRFSTFRERFDDYIEAAKSIDSWHQEFACLSLSYSMEREFNKMFNPKPIGSTWVFNDLNFTDNEPKEVKNQDELDAKEYRVIALLFAHEMTKTGDFHL